MRILASILFIYFSIPAAAQLKHSLNNTRSSNQGGGNFYAIGTILGNRQNPYLQQTGSIYFSPGYEYQDIHYIKYGLRFKLNSDLLSDILYYITTWAAGVPNSLDERYEKSAFNAGILEWMTTINVYTKDKVNIGGGFVVYDMLHTFFDPVVRPSRPEGSPARGYAVLAGPAIHADFLLDPTFTLHTDVYRGFGLYHNFNDDLSANGFAKNPFSSWKATAMVLHNSTGLFLGIRHHQAIPKSHIGLSGSRTQLLLGVRLKMGRYNGESYKDDPRRTERETF